MKAKVFLLAFFIMNVFQVSAQSNDEVTLVVSADGTTKDEAVKTALRSAIEQTYGTFVSANTTILNDELVKDEIVTVSNGNIKEYKEIDCINLADGRPYVTLQATVSISKLVSYAQSKGAETEFAGATLGANLAIYELNKKNEAIVLKNMIAQWDAMGNTFDYEVELGDPKILPKTSSYEEIQRSSSIPYSFINQIKEILKPNSQYKDTIDKRLVKFVQDRVEKNMAEIPCHIYVTYNKTTDAMCDMYFNILNSLELTKEQYEEALRLGLNPSRWGGSFLAKNIYMRTDGEDIPNPFEFIKKKAGNFIIADNVSSPTELFHATSITPASLFGNCLFPYPYRYNRRTNKVEKSEYLIIGKRLYETVFCLYIPVDELAKYRKFEVKPKED